MLLWFLGTSVLTVWYVFRDPGFDYRLLLVGSLTPDIVDVPFRQARWAHSLTICVAVLIVVMLATIGRRSARRVLLALPIGMLLHLVWDGAFASTRVFWWPFSGSWGDVEVPSLSRGLWDVPLELIGLGLLAWAARRFGLGDPARRWELLRAGTLREPAPPDAEHPPARRRT